MKHWQTWFPSVGQRPLWTCMACQECWASSYPKIGFLPFNFHYGKYKGMGQIGLRPGTNLRLMPAQMVSEPWYCIAMGGSNMLYMIIWRVKSSWPDGLGENTICSHAQIWPWASYATRPTIICHWDHWPTRWVCRQWFNWCNPTKFWTVNISRHLPSSFEFGDIGAMH